MKRLLILAVLCTLPLMLAPRGGSSSSVKNLMPTCAATSGACPSDQYFCESSSVVWVCRTTGSTLGWTKITVADEAITEAKLNARDTASDEECLTYEGDDGKFEWQACGSGGGGSAIVLDLSNDDADESSGVTEIATVEATPLIITEVTDDTILIDTTQDWPNAATATALAANAANCAAGTVPLGVDASGAAESCLDVITEAELTTEGELETQISVANMINEEELDTFAEIDALVADKSLINKADGGTIANAVVIDGSGNEVQLIVEGFATQDGNIMEVRLADDTKDLFVVNDSAPYVTIGDPGDGGRGITFTDNTTGTVSAPSAGGTTLHAVGGVFYKVDTGDAGDGNAVVTGTTADTHGPVMWGKDAGDAFDTGTKICAAVGLTCAVAHSLDGTERTCAYDHTTAYFYANCK